MECLFNKSKKETKLHQNSMGGFGERDGKTVKMNTDVINQYQACYFTAACRLGWFFMLFCDQGDKACRQWDHML